MVNHQKNFVNHPRYGNKPIPSGFDFSASEVKNAYWKYDKLSFFPETAIPANIDRQNYGDYPRCLYVDIEEVCRSCNKPFIFFAQEQKYWFESLGFYIDAHGIRCIHCRKADREIKQLKNHYNALIIKKERTPEEIEDLKSTAAKLLQSGIIKNKYKVNRINKL